MAPISKPPEPALGSLDGWLEELSARALLVVSAASPDPCLAPFVGPVRLAGAFALAPLGGEPRLGFLNPMERGEAARSGLSLFDPAILDIARFSRDGAPPHEFLAHVLSRGLQLAELAPGPLALAGHLPAGQLWGACEILAQEGWSFVPGESLVQRLRKAKGGLELAEIGRAARGIEAVMRRVAEILAHSAAEGDELRYQSEPLTVGRLRREIGGVLGALGLEQPAGNIVAAGEEGAVPHTTGDDARILRARESIVVDLFPRSLLFADCTRTFCVGEPPEELARAHRAVSEALELAREQVRPGVRGWSIQERVCEHFAELGWETPISHPSTERGYVHGLGHGLGYELHEYPSFRKEAEKDGLLEVGDVFTLEPGLYDPQAGWAVRIEDVYHLGPEGIEVITHLPWDLDPRAWS